jgi:hypothetical protein
MHGVTGYGYFEAIPSFRISRSCGVSKPLVICSHSTVKKRMWLMLGIHLHLCILLISLEKRPEEKTKVQIPLVSQHNSLLYFLHFGCIRNLLL